MRCMITEEDKKAIIEISDKYHVKKVILFGSSLTSDESRDIDLGVEGIPEKDFFKYYGDLIFGLSKPVDLIDLSLKSKFTELVKKRGMALYG